jgi:hypothetical protein
MAALEGVVLEVEAPVVELLIKDLTPVMVPHLLLAVVEVLVHLGVMPPAPATRLVVMEGQVLLQQSLVLL